jgi:aryl-alcohol dehydrogenase-like predicted oxidoreductase
VPYDVALDAVEELRPLVPAGATMAAFALRWILMEEAVTVVIPGAKTPAQARPMPRPRGWRRCRPR